MATWHLALEPVSDPFLVVRLPSSLPLFLAVVVVPYTDIHPPRIHGIGKAHAFIFILTTAAACPRKPIKELVYFELISQLLACTFPLTEPSMTLTISFKTKVLPNN